MKFPLSQFSAAFLCICFLLVTIRCSPILKKGEPQGQIQKLTTPELQKLEFSSLALQAKFVPQVLPIPVRKKTQFKLYFWDDLTGSAVGPYTTPPFTPSVRLWMQMESGSHGSPGEITVTQSLDANGDAETGVYDVKGLVFTMSGEWEVHLELKQANGTIADAVVQNVGI